MADPEKQPSPRVENLIAFILFIILLSIVILTAAGSSPFTYAQF